ncbi:aquaporin [Pseudonocardia pini]|uniref:aquaporin n=1 Tax=Pseudonocardia pini TaxID=2758030 RepID=UPI0028A951DB|nr:aquaporin [Pseudonocardia pini]
MGRKVIAEAVGTFVLVFFAVGSAVVGFETVGPLGVAVAFGFVLLALAYAIGPISGCHVNPAVTLGVLLNRGITPREAGAYVVAQVVGAVVAGGLLKLLVVAGGVTDETGGLGTNAWGESVNLFGALIVEIILTALLVLVVLLVTHANASPGFAGLAIGLVLTVIHLVGIPLTGTSVNPARSIGPALFAGTQPLSQLWLFIVAPLVGAVLAVGVYRALVGTRSGLGATTSHDPTGAAVDR